METILARVRGKLAATAAWLLLLGLGVATALSVFATNAASSETTTGGTTAPPPTVTMPPPPPPTVDGHGVAWWAQRARSNGRTARKRGRSLQVIRSSLHRRVQLGANGLEQAFLCVHGFEGSWWDPAPPYWGGLQMDRSFMASYGGEFYRAFGPASNWTPAMQVATAERAYLSGRGWSPWPNTSRMCGLR